ncbi:unnamed protein product [Schistosoma margrebowiei]|uniref:Uncharacterized protein n=1 Tax=Schistosoma margrebowiei TaxID=48269 RepID=A0A183L9V3_9TREM|nr:unnamed protein product [Schistosoma margrebowiei]
MHNGKTKTHNYKTENINPFTLDGETREDVESFTFLGSIIDEQEGSDADVKVRIGKARTAFLQFNNIWNSKQLSVNQYQSENLQYQRQDSQFYCMELKLGEVQQPSSRRTAIDQSLTNSPLMASGCLESVANCITHCHLKRTVLCSSPGVNIQSMIHAHPADESQI